MTARDNLSRRLGAEEPARLGHSDVAHRDPARVSDPLRGVRRVGHRRRCGGTLLHRLQCLYLPCVLECPEEPLPVVRVIARRTTRAWREPEDGTPG
jgi:hypothetical protein